MFTFIEKAGLNSRCKSATLIGPKYFELKKKYVDATDLKKEECLMCKIWAFLEDKLKVNSWKTTKMDK